MSEHATSALKHQFDDLDQQHEASSLGMWVFLTTEIMFFGGLFCGYTMYRTAYPDAWAAGSRAMELHWGAINTVVLITSSLTMAMAIHAAQIGKRIAALAYLTFTFLLGLGFLGIKAIEYHGHWIEGQFPGFMFRWPPEGVMDKVQMMADPKKVELFFSFYWVMTGMHALHMIIGLGIVTVVGYNIWKGRYMLANSNTIEMTGLYWHFVDIIWIFLFPLLYLIDVHK